MPLLGLRQPGQPGHHTRVAHRRGRQRLPHLREVGQQRARPHGREQRREPLPVDVGHGQHPDVRTDGPAQCRQRALRCHRADPLCPQVFLGITLGGHAAVGPGTPGDRRGGETAGAPRVGEPVEVGVGRGVGRLPARAPGARDGGEQHERVDVTDQFVQVLRARDLGRQHTLELGQVLLRQRREGLDARGVYDGVRRVLVQQCLQRVPVGHVARGHHHGDPQLQQLLGTWRVQATTGRQHQLLGTGLGQPAGHPTAQGARATGHQDRAARRPVRRATSGRHQPSTEDAGRSDGDLVLSARQHGDQSVQRLRVQFREVDQTAPAGGVLQRDDPTETPELREFGRHHDVVPAGRHRAAGREPQRGVDVPHQVHGGEHVGDQRKDTVELPHRHCGRLGHHDVQAARGQSVDQRGLVVRRHHQPATGRPARRGDGLPLDPVRPGRTGTPFHQFGQRVHSRRQIAVVDDGPELGLVDHGRDLRAEPEPLVLEGVRRQCGLARAGASEVRGPVDGLAAHVQRAQRPQQRGDL